MLVLKKGRGTDYQNQNRALQYWLLQYFHITIRRKRKDGRCLLNSMETFREKLAENKTQAWFLPQNSLLEPAKAILQLCAIAQSFGMGVQEVVMVS